MRVRTCGLAAVSALLVVSAACTRPPAETSTVGFDESLAASLRTVGFPCAELVSSRPLDDEATVWRVACGQSQAYLASIERGSEICMSPLVYGDGLVPQPQQTRTLRIVPRGGDGAAGSEIEIPGLGSSRPQQEADSRCVPYAAG